MLIAYATEFLIKNCLNFCLYKLKDIDSWVLRLKTKLLWIFSQCTAGFTRKIVKLTLQIICNFKEEKKSSFPDTFQIRLIWLNLKVPL